jgi:hypothetical protein
MGMEQQQNVDQHGNTKVVGQKTVPLPFHLLRITHVDKS